MQAARNFYHDGAMYKKGQKVDIKDLSDLKELKSKGLVADKVDKSKAKKD